MARSRLTDTLTNDSARGEDARDAQDDRTQQNPNEEEEQRRREGGPARAPDGERIPDDPVDTSGEPESNAQETLPDDETGEQADQPDAGGEAAGAGEDESQPERAGDGEPNQREMRSRGRGDVREEIRAVERDVQGQRDTQTADTDGVPDDVREQIENRGSGGRERGTDPTDGTDDGEASSDPTESGAEPETTPEDFDEGGVETQAGELGQQARAFEDEFVEENPELTSRDVRIEVEDGRLVTRVSEQAQRRVAVSTITSQLDERFSGVDITESDIEVTEAEDGGFRGGLTETAAERVVGEALSRPGVENQVRAVSDLRSDELRGEFAEFGEEEAVEQQRSAVAEQQARVDRGEFDEAVSSRAPETQQTEAVREQVEREQNLDFAEFKQPGRVTPGGAVVPGSGIVGNPSPGLEVRKAGAIGEVERAGDADLSRITDVVGLTEPGPADPVEGALDDALAGVNEFADEVGLFVAGLSRNPTSAADASGEPGPALDVDETIDAFEEGGVSGLVDFVQEQGQQKIDAPGKGGEFASGVGSGPIRVVGGGILGLAKGSLEAGEAAGFVVKQSQLGQRDEAIDKVLAAGTEAGTQAAEAIASQPYTVGGEVLSSLGVSAAAFKAASAVGPRTSLATRAAIQPGEELLGHGGFAVTKRVAGTGTAQRFFPNKEPLIFSEESAVRQVRRAKRGLESRLRSVDIDTPRAPDSVAAQVRKAAARSPRITLTDRRAQGLLSADPRFKEQIAAPFRTTKQQIQRVKRAVEADDPTDLGRPITTELGEPSLEEAGASAGARVRGVFRSPDQVDLGRPLSTDLGETAISEVALMAGRNAVQGASRSAPRLSTSSPGRGRPLATDFDAPTVETAVTAVGRQAAETFGTPSSVGLGRPLATEFDAPTAETAVFETGRAVQRGLDSPSDVSFPQLITPSDTGGLGVPLATEFDAPTIETAAVGAGRRFQRAISQPSSVSLGRPIATDFDVPTVETGVAAAGRQLSRTLGTPHSVDLGRALATEFDAPTAETAAFRAGRFVRDTAQIPDFASPSTGRFQLSTGGPGLGRPLATDFDAPTAETAAFGAGRRLQQTFGTPSSVDLGRPLATEFDAPTAETVAAAGARRVETTFGTPDSVDLGRPLITDIGQQRGLVVQGRTDLGRPLATELDEPTVETAVASGLQRLRSAGTADSVDLGRPLITDIARRRGPVIQGQSQVDLGRPLATELDEPTVETATARLLTTGIRFQGGRPPRRSGVELDVSESDDVDAVFVETGGGPRQSDVDDVETPADELDVDPSGVGRNRGGFVTTETRGGQRAILETEARRPRTELEDDAELESATEPRVRVEPRVFEPAGDSVGLEPVAPVEGQSSPQEVKLEEGIREVAAEANRLSTEVFESEGIERGIESEFDDRRDTELESELEQELEQEQEIELESELELEAEGRGGEAEGDRDRRFDPRDDFEKVFESDVATAEEVLDEDL